VDCGVALELVLEGLLGPKPESKTETEGKTESTRKLVNHFI
jgi:hypothetical protein